MPKRFLNVDQPRPPDTHTVVFICLFIVGCAGSLLLHGLSSSCCEWVSLLRCLCWLQSMDSRAHGLRSVATAPGPWGASSVIVTLRLTCSAACGVFPTQGSRDCATASPASAGGPFPLSPQGSPPRCFLCSLSALSTERCGSGLGDVKGKTLQNQVQSPQGQHSALQALLSRLVAAAGGSG